MFQDLLDRIQHDIVHSIYRVGLIQQSGSGPRRPAIAQPQPQKAVVGGSKVGRNSACPCGSGKKYKRCHGVAA